MKLGLPLLVLLLLPAAVCGQQELAPDRAPEIHGSVALSWYQFEDATESDLDISRPTLRLRLKASRLFGSDWNLRVKFRSRYYDRSRSPRTDGQKTEWRNRAYEISLSYDDPAAPLNLRLGRIVSNAMSGIGYIDGALVQHNAAEHWLWGIFAGTQPDWKTSDFQTSIQKYGVFAKYLKGDYLEGRFEATLAAAGEYHETVISREYVFLQSSYHRGRDWSLRGSLELDVNRLWRKDRSGEDLSVTGLFLTGRYRVTESVSTTLSYDNRKSYYTYETRSKPDSLFNNVFRHGVRANVDVRLPGALLVTGSFGVRGEESKDDNTYSYALGMRKRDVLPGRLTVNARVGGFSNPYSSGFTPTLRIGRAFRGGRSLHMSYGNYTYTLESTETTRSSHWARVEGQLVLPARFHLSGSYEYDWGDDVEGHRLLAELGYRF